MGGGTYFKVGGTSARWKTIENVCGNTVHPYCKLCKKKIANRNAAVAQDNNAVDHKRNKDAVADVERLHFPVVA